MTLEETIENFAKKYPQGVISVGRPVQLAKSKKELKEKGSYEAYVTTDYRIGEKTFFSGNGVGLSAIDSLNSAIAELENKKTNFNLKERELKK